MSHAYEAALCGPSLYTTNGWRMDTILRQSTTYDGTIPELLSPKRFIVAVASYDIGCENGFGG
jgi:hypothetical protein